MSRPGLKVRISTIAALGVCSTLAASSAAGAFGSLNALGQNAEHERITREIAIADPAWQPNSLSLLAGRVGNFGGVGAPDRPWDSSSSVLKGSGPGYKHCDDGDFLSARGYPHAAIEARTALESCIDYYQTLMDRAVAYSGTLVSPDLSVNPFLFDDTGKWDPVLFQPDKNCQYAFSLAREDGGPKCNVMNALGRALHMAEDVYAHSNWADLADPSKPISITNPPGLGQTGIPAFLRYPADTVVPDGLITGCDDTLSGTQNCDNRVTHSALAKDNGEINDDGSTSPTSKYPRGSVTVNGITNFQRAVIGAKKQAVSTWSDFKAAVLEKYGPVRGEKILEVIRSDKAPASTVVKAVASTTASATASPSASPTASASVSPTSSPTASPTASPTSSPTASTAPSPTASPTAREAGAFDSDSANMTLPAPTSSSSTIWWIALAVLVVIVVIALAIIRSSRRHRNVG